MKDLLPDTPPHGVLGVISRHLLRAEMLLGAVLAAIIFALIPANAVLRHYGHPLLWAEELAVHLMVWLAFIGGSVCIATRQHMAIGLLPDRLSPRGRQRLAVLCDLLVLCFLLVMGWLCWLWFDPVGLWRAGDARSYAQASFNFTWSEPMLTMHLRKVWFWLIVPVSLVVAMVHTLAVLADDVAGRIPPRSEVPA